MFKSDPDNDLKILLFCYVLIQELLLTHTLVPLVSRTYMIKLGARYTAEDQDKQNTPIWQIFLKCQSWFFRAFYNSETRATVSTAPTPTSA